MTRTLTNRPANKSYLGDAKPGDDSHSLICDAVSSCRIFLRSASISGPGFSLATWASSLAFSAAMFVFKCVRGGSATLHDTTSLLTGPDRRVCKSDPKYAEDPVSVPKRTQNACRRVWSASVNRRASNIPRAGYLVRRAGFESKQRWRNVFRSAPAAKYASVAKSAADMISFITTF